MSFSPREKRAIAYVDRQNGWKLTLQSGKPTVFFLDQNGQTITEDISPFCHGMTRAEKQMPESVVLLR